MNIPELIYALAQNDEDRKIAAAILREAEFHEGFIEVHDQYIEFAAAEDASSYTTWPISFQYFIEKIGSIRLGVDELVIGEGADRGLDNLTDLIRGTELQDQEEFILRAIEHRPNWWIYHPHKKNQQNEPLLFLLEEGGTDFNQSGEAHIGSLTLKLLADALELDTTPPYIALDDKSIHADWLSQLNTDIKDIYLEKNILYSCEEPENNLDRNQSPDEKKGRLSLYDFSNPQHPSRIAFLSLNFIPAKLLVIDDSAIILGVDWQQRCFHIVEIDIGDSKSPTLKDEIYKANIDKNTSLRDCVREAALVCTDKHKILARLCFNESGRKDLVVLTREDRRWTLASEHEFLDVSIDTPFLELKEGEELIASADSLWRLFDLHWGKLAIIGSYAFISGQEIPQEFYTLTESGKKSAALRFARRHNYSTLLTTWGDYVVVSSYLGIDFIRILPDGALAKNLFLERNSRAKVICTDEFMFVIEQPLPSENERCEYKMDIFALTTSHR